MNSLFMKSPFMDSPFMDSRARQSSRLGKTIFAGSLALGLLFQSLLTAAPLQATEQPAATPPVAGELCMTTGEFDVQCLSSEGEWRLPAEEDSSIYSVEGLLHCGDGSLWLTGSDYFHLTDDTILSATPENYPSAEACDSKGRLWVAEQGGKVSYYDGKKWTSIGSPYKANSDQADDYPAALAVANDGKVYLAMYNTMATYDGKKWKAFPKQKAWGDYPSFAKMTVDSRGQLWVLQQTETGLVKFDGKKWTGYKQPADFAYAIPKDIHADSQGRVWVATNLGLLALNDGEWSVFTTEEDNLASNLVNSVSVDAAGRVWVGTIAGLSLFDGESWITYRMDNSDILDNGINSLAVVGSGPAVLPEFVSKDPGQLQGTLFKDGEAVVDATVEICMMVVTTFTSFEGDTPCEGQSMAQQTTTNVKGDFSFDEVPAGYYVLLISHDNGWTFLTDELGIGAGRIQVNAGEPLDLGTITLEKDK